MPNELNYDFFTPSQIVFGWGRRREVGALAAALGRRAFIVCGLPETVAKDLLAEITASLNGAGVDAVRLADIQHEPEVDDVDRLSGRLRDLDAGNGDFLLAVGGGAAIDLAKAAGAMAVNRQSDTVKDYLEGVGRGLRLVERPLPLLAMPTTAGTGAEATKNAVISSYNPPFKKSLRDNRLMPRVALVDPELTVSMPAATTAASGMDAITQLIESYVSLKSQPIPRALAIQGLRLAVPAIVEAVEKPDSRPARVAMSHAALLSGMALANSGLGMAHGVAAALGIHCRVPHGVACALMLPVAIRANLEAAQADFARLNNMIFGRESQSPSDAAHAFLAQIEELCDRVGTPRWLSQVGVTRRRIPAIVASSRGSSFSGNPRDLSDAELTAILENLL